jgi:two-component system chemotaxis response regulator CheY
VTAFEGDDVRALVIDDSRAMRTVLKRTLVSLGMDVLEAGDGRSALSVIEEHGLPKLAIVDWNMPVMDGLEFVTELRQREGGRDVVIMMVTTENEGSQVVRALAAGAHEYVFKPFTPDAIAAKLALLGLVEPEAGHTATEV